LLILLQKGKSMAFENNSGWQVYDDAGHRKYLNEDERRRFLSAADRLDAPMRVLCHTLALTGLRISEALSLCQHQLDGARQTLTVKTLKRRKVVFRSIPIPQYLASDLRELLADRQGQIWTMHRATAWRAVKRAMDVSGVVGPMACCKGLRHSFGIRAAECNVPPSLIQRWMGHASPNTTAVYLDAIGVEEQQFARRMWD
jgi:integrase/recombinase XerD